MAFIESPRFPDNISYGSTGGPTYKTEVISVHSGYEFNNISWEQGRHRYDASMGVRSESELSDLIKFFHLARGRGHKFRYKDWLDYKSCDIEATVTAGDQIFGVGDDFTTTFQLIKTYALPNLIGIDVNQRDITKPVDGTVLIAVGPDTKVEDTDYTIDYTTGIVTFTNPPDSGLPVTWGGEFDVPCRFDMDELPLSLDFYGYASGTVPIIEIRV